MGSSSKKYKEKSDRKRRHRSRSPSEDHEAPREKRHKHKKHHHKDRRREKQPSKHYDYESADSDVVEISPENERTPSPPRMEKSPEATGQSTDSLSINETNKLRAKLGLKPLQVSGDTQKKKSDTKKDDGKKKDDYGEFYHKPAGNIAHTTKSEKIKEKLSVHKEKRHIENKLAKVSLLGDSDGEDDASAWVQKSRHIQEAKKEAEKRAKMLEELDEQFGISAVIEQDRREKRDQKYSEKNLKGLRVDHNMDNFQEGKTVILTLKDSEILKEDDDVLVNVNMIDDERYKQSNENKKKKITYNPYDVQEFDEFGNPKEKVLLEKYDEEIDGKKQESFTIGVDSGAERKQAVLENIKQKLANKVVENLDSTRLTLASEYYNEQEMAKFKKPKKKVRKIRSKGKIMSADDLEVKSTGIENVGTRRPKKEEMHMDIDDIPEININTDDIKLEEKDNTLERALHKARKLKQKENAANSFLNDVVNTMKTEVKEEPPIDSGNIVLNSTAEFCRTLGDIPTYGKAGNREETEDLLDFEKEAEQSDDDDCQIIEQVGGSWNSVDPNVKHVPESYVQTEVPILDEEPDVGSGVGAALKLAMSKGYLDKEESNRPSNSRLAYLQAKHYSIEDKNYGDEQERGGGRRERYTGPVQDFRERDGFKPNVKLEYIDDEGHVLNSKEAFRYLSHKFHGKGPGKNKIEKRIKKTQQEGLMKKMSSTDTPLGTLNMLQAKQKEMQTPYIVLSGGKTHSTSISKTRR